MHWDFRQIRTTSVLQFSACKADESDQSATILNQKWNEHKDYKPKTQKSPNKCDEFIYHSNSHTGGLDCCMNRIMPQKTFNHWLVQHVLCFLQFFLCKKSNDQNSLFFNAFVRNCSKCQLMKAGNGKQILGRVNLWPTLKSANWKFIIQCQKKLIKLYMYTDSSNAHRTSPHTFLDTD